jgi:hypothetical protein
MEEQEGEELARGTSSWPLRWISEPTSVVAAAGGALRVEGRASTSTYYVGTYGNIVHGMSAGPRGRVGDGPRHAKLATHDSLHVYVLGHERGGPTEIVRLHWSGQRKQVIARPRGWVLAMTCDWAGHLYWTEHEHGVFRCRVDGAGDVEMVAEDDAAKVVAWPTGVAWTRRHRPGLGIRSFQGPNGGLHWQLPTEDVARDIALGPTGFVVIASENRIESHPTAFSWPPGVVLAELSEEVWCVAHDSRGTYGGTASGTIWRLSPFSRAAEPLAWMSGVRKLCALEGALHALGGVHSALFIEEDGPAAEQARRARERLKPHASRGGPRRAWWNRARAARP